MAVDSIQSVAARLAKRIYLYATACALLISSLQAVYSWQHVEDEFEEAIRNVGLMHVPTLSVSVWDIEPEAIRRQLTRLAEQREIGYVRLSAAVGPVFEAGDPSLRARSTPRIFDIPQPNSKSGTIGTLEVVANPKALYWELAYTVGAAMVGYGLLTVLICGLVLVVLKRELEQPLRHVAEFVKTLKPERLAAPLLVERGRRHRRDEIDLVVEGFQILQREIDNHIGNLDCVVAERTRELEQAMESIRHLSTVDALTGCYNRRLFDERIGAEAERAGRYQRPLSMVFADVDWFKKINDTWGHAAGDVVLRAVAAVLQRGVRDSVDWIVRYGGEEFVMVLPETDLDHARAMAERIRGAVEREAIAVNGDRIAITASFGVAQYGVGENVDAWVARADKCLYQAKQSGRNRVCG